MNQIVNPQLTQPSKGHEIRVWTLFFLLNMESPKVSKDSRIAIGWMRQYIASLHQFTTLPILIHPCHLLPGSKGGACICVFLLHFSAANLTKQRQWLFLVPLKGGRWHIIPQLAVYRLYATYHLLGEPETTIDNRRSMTLRYGKNTSKRLKDFTNDG